MPIEHTHTKTKPVPVAENSSRVRGGRNGERFADVRSEVVGAVIRQQHQSSYHFPSEYIIAL